MKAFYRKYIRKYTPLTFIGLFALTTLIFAGFYIQELGFRKLMIKSDERRTTELLQKVIENKVKINAYNLIYLANHKQLHHWLNTGENEQGVIRLFELFCKETGIYDQARFLNIHGKEMIRINQSGGSYAPVAEHELQKKAGRYYFRQTFDLSPGQLFVSPFDLNIEHGRIELPEKPMIRFGMPVFSTAGDKKGIVLLNYLGADLISRVDEKTREGPGKIMLINRDGYWIKALDPDDEWGFMMPGREHKTIARQDPDLWKQVTQQDNGQFWHEQALYSYTTIRFTGIGILGATEPEQADGGPVGNRMSRDFSWKIVSMVDKGAFDRLEQKVLRQLLPFFSTFILIMLGISAWLGLAARQRRKAQKALDQNEAELSSLFKAVPSGIGMVCDRVIRQVNHRLCQMTGYSKEELLGQPSRLLYPSDREFEFVGKEKYDQIRQFGTGSVETLWERKNGSIIHVLLSSTPVNPDNLSEGVTFSAYDITARKKTEEQLAASRQRYRNIIETSSDGIFTLDKKLRFSSFNAALELMTGQMRNNWIKKSYKKLFLPEDLTDVSGFIQQVFDGYSPPTREFGITTYSKTKRICEFKLKPRRNEENTVTGVIGFVKDITERKKAKEKVERIERQLRQSQKMEAIGTLAGGIAHDFNNILSGIFGYSQLTLMNIETPQKAKEHLNQVIKGAQRATTLVQQILTFSRQAEFEKKPLIISIAIKEAIKLLRSSIPSTISIKTNLTSQAKVNADPTQVHQVIMNLCTNAYHAMAATGGVLTVNLEEVALSGKDQIPDPDLPSGNYLKLEIMDTGTGIEDKYLEKIFNPYFTTKEVGKGTGLGLALVDGIVKNHNGFVKVNSRKDKGTAFQVFWPVIDRETVLEKDAVVDSQLPSGTENIMLVDDEAGIRDPFSMVLKEYGYTVFTFEDGVSALSAFRGTPNRFDLVVTDLTMPKMTGDRLTREILKIRPDTPVLLCTGYSEKFTESMAAEIGIRHYLQKPILPPQLLTVIRDVLDESESPTAKAEVIVLQ